VSFDSGKGGKVGSIFFALVSLLLLEGKKGKERPRVVPEEKKGEKRKYRRSVTVLRNLQNLDEAMQEGREEDPFLGSKRGERTFKLVCF